MDATVEQVQTLLELEARHDELLARLAELDERVARVLAQCQAAAATEQTVVPPAQRCGDVSDRPSPVQVPLAAGLAPSSPPEP